MTDDIGELTLAHLFGRRLLNIYGHHETVVEDQTEDASSWWLEFEGGVWVHPDLVIAPACVSPTFALVYRLSRSAAFPMAGSPLPFVKNPPVLQPVLGLALVAELDRIGDDFADTEMRLGFGRDGQVTVVMRIGYFRKDSGLAIELAPVRPPEATTTDQETP